MNVIAEWSSQSGRSFVRLIHDEIGYMLETTTDHGGRRELISSVYPASDAAAVAIVQGRVDRGCYVIADESFITKKLSRKR